MSEKKKDESKIAQEENKSASLHQKDSENDSKENTKKESEKHSKEDTKEISEKSSKENMRKEPEKSSKEDTKEHSEKNLQEDTKKEPEKASKENTKKESEKDLKEDTKKESEKDLKEDTKKESEKGLKEDTKKESEKDLQEGTKKTSEKDSKKDKKEEPEKNSEKSTKNASKNDIEKESDKDFEHTDKKESEDNKKDSKESEDNKKDSKDNEKNVAISQSKRLADAKTAMNADSGNVKASVSKQPKSKKASWIILGTVAVLILIAYISGFVYFSGHFYQDVAINGINVSDMNEAEAQNTLSRFYDDYKLIIKTIDDNEVVINGKDISMQISLRDEFDSCLQQQQPYLWFLNMFKHHDYEVGVDGSWNKEELENIYDSMDILKKEAMIAPEDAYVGVVEGKFTLVKERMGTTLNEQSLKAVVEDSLAQVRPNVELVDAGCYDLPKVYDTDGDLRKELDAKNEFAENVITLKLDDLVLEPGMELYNEVLEENGDSYKISEKKVEKYVKSLAEEYDTLGTERTFTTSFDKKQIEILGNAFGYELNQEETRAALYKALTSGKPETVEAVFNNTGYTLQGENDIGDTYIEVNLSEQRVIAYKNGKKLTEGDCVSGKEADGHGTCVGLYAIQGKQSPSVLRGEKKQVTKTVTKKKKGKKVKVEETKWEYEYESPVTFWMPFNGGIGLHDAAGWRSQYGGSIYYYSGSHGCVNLPYDLAKTLYENYEIGDPVVVYFWDNENRR